MEFLLTDGRMNVTVHYQFYSGIYVVRSWTVVENISDMPIGLEYVSSFAYTGFNDGMLTPNENIRLFIPHNSWQRENNWKEYSLSELGIEKNTKFSGKRIMVSNTGSMSTKEYLPMCMIHNLETQSTYLWQIENNGSWQWEISDISDMLYFKISGPTEQENFWYKELAKGERFESVKVYIAVGNSVDSVVEQLTKYRRIIVSNNVKSLGMPVIFNDYMNCLKGDPTEEKILPMLDKAAEVGAEIYCMDSGWYADGHWWDTVGEWKECDWRFPNGIKSIANYAREKGMIFGIWLEIESMGINCPLADKFEDECFFMRHGKRVIDHGRYQLDFRNQKVRDYAMSIVDRLVNEYGVGYIKNDYNIEIGIGTEINSDSVGDGLLEGNRAFLSWHKEVKEKYPDLVLECCASGGMRMDYATLSLGHLQSVSDQTNYVINSNISAAASLAVIPEQAAIWTYPKVGVDDSNVAFNMINSMLQRIHLSGALADQTDSGIALIKEGIECYKSYRYEITEAIPFYPLGIPQYSDKLFCCAYRYPKCIRIAVWRLDTEDSELYIPLNENICGTKILYPQNNCCNLHMEKGGIRVCLKNKFTAVLIQCNLV